MSFVVHTDGHENRYEEFHPMIAFIADKLAYWNNFEVEQGRTQITITIMKPVDPNALGVSVNEAAGVAERLS